MRGDGGCRCGTAWAADRRPSRATVVNASRCLRRTPQPAAASVAATAEAGADSRPIRTAFPRSSSVAAAMIYSQWAKLCLKEPTRINSVCFTGKDGRLDSGMMIASAARIEPQGEPKKLLRVNVPLGIGSSTAPAYYRPGPPRDRAYVAAASCSRLRGRLRGHRRIDQPVKKWQRSASRRSTCIGQPFSVPLPLADFAKAYDGPPTDPQVIEEQQKKLGPVAEE